MNFDLPEELEMLRQMVREFAEQEVRPLAPIIDREARFPDEIVKKAAELGLLGINVPDQYGGSGLPSLATAITIEEISRCCKNQRAGI